MAGTTITPTRMMLKQLKGRLKTARRGHKLMLGLNPNETYVRVACEVGGNVHGNMVISELRNHGYHVELDEMK